MYTTPPEYYFRLHFERSRFTRRLEDMLLLLANKITNIGMMDAEQFNELLDKIIADSSPTPLQEKTVRNQRTEMIKLFGLVKYEDDLAIPGTRLAILMQTQDTPRFFKSFCNKFQFPGGFLKPDKVSEMVVAGIHFKPAQYLLKLFKIANSKYGDFALNAAEVTHFVFYDTRVTVTGETPDKALERMVEARKNDIELDKSGDTIRYARDFLNYMVEANLLTEYQGMFALNEKEGASIKSIIADPSFFTGYYEIIGENGGWDKDDYKAVSADWMEYFADSSDNDESFQTSATALVRDDSRYPEQWKKIKEMLERKDPELRGSALKEIGDEGEKIAYEYEKDWVKKVHPNMSHMVRLVSQTAALGYDLLSVKDENSRRKKYIEIKTTKKNYQSGSKVPFTISINEWSVAQQFGDDYFIYRVIISKEGITIFSIQNPAKKAEDGNLDIEPIGYKVIYSDNSGVLLDM